MENYNASRDKLPVKLILIVNLNRVSQLCITKKRKN